MSQADQPSLDRTVLPVAPGNCGQGTSPRSTGSTSSSSTSGQGTSVGPAGSADSDQSLTEEHIRSQPQIVLHPDSIVDVGCSCQHGHHGNVSCTIRREIRFSYFNRDRENALLCERCYPQPRRLVASQIRLTPCQCRCEGCAPEPPPTSEPDAPSTQRTDTAYHYIIGLDQRPM